MASDQIFPRLGGWHHIPGLCIAVIRDAGDHLNSTSHVIQQTRPEETCLLHMSTLAHKCHRESNAHVIYSCLDKHVQNEFVCKLQSTCMLRGRPYYWSGSGAGGNREKNSEALLQEKINFERHSPEKNILWEVLSRKKIFERPCFLYGRGSWEKINSFRKFPLPPRSLMVDPLVFVRT